MKSQSFKSGLVTLILISLMGCSGKNASYTDANGPRALKNYTDSVSTNGLGSETGYETLQAVNDPYSKTAISPKNNVFYFSFDNTELSSEDIAFIQSQAKYLLSHPNAKLFLGGHTDERGSREYNVGLGERRAKRVSEILHLAGVPTHQFRLVSYGREKPQVLGHSESAWSKNRRVEFSYESMG